jgi:hypothetical protein
MGEKKGKTIKLIYDFPTQLSTEVFEHNVWNRVTCINFRSFNGSRRILKFYKNGDSYYEEYSGPVFLFETNTKLKDMSKKGYVYSHDIQPKGLIRQSELDYLKNPKIDKNKYIYK